MSILDRTKLASHVSLIAPHPRLAALAVAVRRERVLLVRRRNEPDAGLWGFPGGHVDWGETVADAATRELREETGVIARPLSHLTSLDVIVRDETNAVAFHFLLVAVLCEYVSGEPVAADDLSDAAWHAISDIRAGCLPCSDNIDAVLDAVPTDVVAKRVWNDPTFQASASTT